MTDFDFNNAGGQKSFDVIPANTICILQMTIRPGGAGDGGWLTQASDGASEGLDCEFTVVEGEYAKRKLWQRFTLEGSTAGHKEAGAISRNTMRAMLESARGIRPDDKGEEAMAKRRISGWGDLDGLRFMARLGVKPAKDNFPAKNTILEIITPDRGSWKSIDQVSPGPSNGGGAAARLVPSQPPAGAITRPNWAS
jgi:hypothetical protein